MEKPCINKVMLSYLIAFVYRELYIILGKSPIITVGDPDLELRGGGGGGFLIYLHCWPFPLLSFLLVLPKIGGLPPSPRPLP